MVVVVVVAMSSLFLLLLSYDFDFGVFVCLFDFCSFIRMSFFQVVCFFVWVFLAG